MGNMTTANQLRYGFDNEVESDRTVRDLANDIARELDTADAGRLASIRRPIAIFRNGSGMTIPVVSVTTVSFTSVEVDTHGMISFPSTPTRITVSAAAGPGIYHVSAHALGGSGTSAWTVIEISLLKNGGAYTRRRYYNSGSTTPYVNVSALMWLGAVADYVTVNVYHEGGASNALTDFYLKVIKVTGN